jgi:cell pole-organizing protein PopZ
LFKDAGMTQAAKTQEPSMEEILASIRRIIADDDASKPSSKPADAPKPASRASSRPAAASSVTAPTVEPEAASVQAEAEDLGSSALQDPDILDLTESMTSATFADAAPTREPVRMREPTRMAEPAPLEHVLSPSQSDEAQSGPSSDDISEVEDELSFAAATVDSPEPENFAEGARIGVPGVSERGQLLSGATSAAVDSAFNALAQTVLVQNARTLEDLVREMLRPMLKTWLDDNLPGLVERLVRSEIERVARGR